MKKANIGTWITTYNPSSIDVISNSNFDWICIDLEHSAINLDQLQNLLTILDKNNTNSFVRVSSNNKNEIIEVLDLGAKGIIVPMVNTATEAKNAVSYTKYPPDGQRGIGLARAQGYGYRIKEYNKISKNIKVVVQIENIQGINNLDKILKIKGLHATLIGPRDLSGSIGKIADFKSRMFINALQKYEKVSRENKIPMGIHIAYPEPLKINQFIRKGYKFIAMGTDMTLLGDSCKINLQKIKK